MKRWIHDPKEKLQDEFDKQWTEKFGPEQQREFDSFEEFKKWLEEVDKFETADNKTV